MENEGQWCGAMRMYRKYIFSAQCQETERRVTELACNEKRKRRRAQTVLICT